jgi:spore coat protein CotF
MTPDDVIIEAIAAASLHGDSPYLREVMCNKLNEVIRENFALYETAPSLIIKSGKE